ncbi:glycosyl hydrolase [Pedobacter chinensis]|uniref:Glycosyl hydrolase n=1 Tax=Pedobacter chinensis TaxID=2282421 RepID=A0A369PYP3_9SPHI|nr:glycoside hydrolase family 3 N-terminal domain-containing protein [Pedobacter chinensis]RDC57360.1 glycosyl hydrolase [Pedobacter chinensis]
MKIKLITLLSISILTFIGKAEAQKTKHVYQDATKPITERIEDLLKRMTLQEKIDQLRHIHSEDYDANGVVDLQKLHEFTKGNSFGCIEGFPLSSKQYLKMVYHVQKYMKQRTRLGIPVIPVLEGLHGTVQDNCTIFPQSIALASTFRPELAKQMSVHISAEMKAIGAKQLFAPDLDLARELRWGRVEETYGEDPFLVGEMGVAYIKGFRENNLICTPKHFVGHGTPIGGINLSNVEGGLKQLYSLYMQPFERVIKEADPLSIMNCYSSYDGEPITGSSFFLTDLLRKHLGFKGFVYSDWGSISMLYSFHHTAANSTDAALQAITAGIDVEAASSTYEELDSLVKSKKLPVSYIDRAVRNVLYTKFKSGLFEDALPDTTVAFKQQIHTPASIKLARTIADESIVLVKNENNILPLDESKLQSLAIIGPNADQVQFGDYTWSRNNRDGITPLNGIKQLIGDKVTINYAKGCELTGLDSTGFAAAVSAAKQSNAAIVFVGSQSAALARERINSTSGEGFDLDDLKLPGVQEELIKAIHRTGKPVIVVLVTGRPFVLSWEEKNVPAIAIQWYGGEQEGHAIAGMLFGKTNPSGKLPISFPKSTGNTPAYYNYLPTERGFYGSPGTENTPGRDYVFAKPGALWPFGYGLSYTKFEFNNLNISRKKVLSSDSITVSIQVKNSGQRDGAEVVQLYVRDLVSSVATPVQALKGFRKVFLKAEEEQIVTLQLPVNELYLYNKDLKRVVEPGDFEIQLGAASNDIRAKDRITVFVSQKELQAAKTLPGKTETRQQIENNTNISNDTTIKVSGIVRDVQASILSDVSIYTKTGETKVVTNDAGSYIITVKSSDILIFSKKGYETKEVPVRNNKILNVTLNKQSEH